MGRSLHVWRDLNVRGGINTPGNTLYHLHTSSLAHCTNPSDCRKPHTIPSDPTQSTPLPPFSHPEMQMKQRVMRQQAVAHVSIKHRRAPPQSCVLVRGLLLLSPRVKSIPMFACCFRGCAASLLLVPRHGHWAHDDVLNVVANAPEGKVLGHLLG